MKPDNFFQFVKENVPLLSLVVEDGALGQQQGDKLWKKTCPFCKALHKFTVSEEKGVYYCFSCHNGGDCISYISHRDKLTARQAACYLVKKYNLIVPKEFEKDMNPPKESHE